MQQGTERTAEKQITCSSDVAFEVKNAKISGNQLNLLIDNRGSRNIDNFIVRITGTNGVESSKTSSGLLNAFDIKSFVLGVNQSKTGTVYEVEVSPSITFEGEEVACSNAYDKETVKNRNSCLGILLSELGSTNGVYSIDPDGDGSFIDVYCDMEVQLMLIDKPGQDGNLLDSSTWVVGSSGSQTGFSQNGETSENSIELGIGPYGQEVALWKGGNDAASDADGGWNAGGLTVDTSKTYRYTVWIKKKVNSGTTYLGLEEYVGLLGGGGPQDNPYFYCGQLPQPDRWYLLVGYLRPYNTLATTAGIGGIYDGITKEKVISFTTFNGNCLSDYKHSGPGDIGQNHRAYLFYDTDINNRQWFYDPRVEVVDYIN